MENKNSKDERIRNVDGMKYRMDHAKRGHFIIINNEVFEPKSGLSDRTGSTKDAENLTKVFMMLGFDVKVNHNCTVEKMEEIMKEESLADHSECDCFGAAILSHGEEEKVYGTDGKLVNIRMLIHPIRDCKSLRKKPKLFFFQACRGEKFDDGVLVEAESDDGSMMDLNEIRIPLEADLLFSYPTSPGYFAWRNSKSGSWYVQELCEQLEKYAFEDDLVGILTRVNYKVAYKYESKAEDPAFRNKKQMPSSVSTLTKYLYFTQKKSLPTAAD